MKKILLTILAGLAIVSCSKNEVLEQNQSEISYAVTTNKATKAAAVYCNNKKFDSFNVIASYTEGTTTKTYIDKDQINGPSWTGTTTRYWPAANDCLDFYAYAPVTGLSVTTPTDWSATPVPTATFTVPDEVASHQDFVYAVMTNQDKADGQVDLNFRHALSQIVFKARNENPKLHLIVSGVEIHNVKNTGTFTFPANNTSGNFVDHGTTDGNVNSIGTQGDWGSTVSGSADYTVVSLEDGNASIEGIEVAYTSPYKTVNLTDFTGTDGASYTADYSKAMLLMPQNGSNWTLPSGKKYTDAEVTNIFFVLNCRIYNVAGASFDAATDVMLHGTIDGTTHKSAKIYLPLQEFTWKQGMKYIYTFVLKDGGIGGGDDEDGKDILQNITYTVTVDDFKKGDETDVNLQ